MEFNNIAISKPNYKLPGVIIVLCEIVEISSLLEELYPSSANHDYSRRHSSIFFHCFSEKIRIDVSSEASARQRIHMKNQALFSSKDKSKKLKCHLLQFLFGALRVQVHFCSHLQ